ncbi:MAG: hypothetical protein HY040_02620 [Planctomycetes bacterium]|nr:hypothetical protein [Planctomycetota bacterium]
MKNGREETQSETAGQKSSAPPSAVKPRRGSRRLLWILLALLAGSTAASFVVFRFVVPSLTSVPRELVGTWQVIEGDKKGARFECRWNGSAVFTVFEHGKKGSEEFSLRVRGKRIFLTTKNATGMEETLIQTILKLTDDELVFRDQDQTVYNMIRIRD